MGVNADASALPTCYSQRVGAYAQAGAAWNLSKSGCRGVRTALRHQPSPLAEGQGPKVPVDDAQQLLGPRQAQGHMAAVKVLHVVAALQVLIHPTLACSARESQSISYYFLASVTACAADFWGLACSFRESSSCPADSAHLLAF